VYKRQVIVEEKTVVNEESKITTDNEVEKEKL